MRPERAVFDTNVLIAAALRPHSPPRAALGAVVAADGKLLFSHETFTEMEECMFRPKFDRYVTHSYRMDFVAEIRRVSDFVRINGAPMGCRDPADDKVLETALIGHAECVVTGDNDLLILSPFRGIPILTPAAFLSV